MTKLIRVSERDTLQLDRLRSLPARPALPQPQDYQNTVVIKPWGYEFLVYQNHASAIWFLHIKHGHSTSMHCHPGKKTSLIVLSGQALCNTFYNRNYLTGIDAVVIEPGVFHATQGLTQEGVFLLEIESPPDKTDLVRLDDQYGRMGRGYEGMSEMRTDNLDTFRHFGFSDPADAVQRHLFGNIEISLIPLGAGAPLQETIGTRKGDFYCACQGQLLDDLENVVLDTADAAEATFFQAFSGLRVAQPCILLKVAPTVS